MPNEPPTLPVSTRTLSAGALRMSRSMFFRPNTPWLHECSVHLSSLRVEFADGRARLHRGDHQALIDQRQLHDMRGLGEGFGDLRGIAIVIIERDIARHVVVEQRRARLARHRARSSPPAAARCRARPLRPRPWLARSVSATTQATGSPTKRTLSVGKRRPRRVVDRRAVAALERQQCI